MFEPAPRSGTERTAVEALAAGVEACHPDGVVENAVTVDDETLVVQESTYPLDAFERVVVVGGGNAAGQMAAALESTPLRVDEGVVVTDDPVETDAVEVVEGSHPYPDEAAVRAVERMRDLAARADADTLVLALVTGGGSALLPAPAGAVSLADLRRVTEQLLESGADIEEINTVRRHLSDLKGGRLATTLAPATTVGLLLSDVTSGDPGTIASGPLSPDPTTFEDARAVLDAYDISPPAAVRDHLDRGRAGAVEETPDADHPAFESASTHVLADNLTAVTAAAEVCRRAGYDTMILSSSVRGEASEAALTHVAVAEETRRSGHPITPPAAIVSGGETTVTVDGDRGDAGTGGPNQEFALAAALELPEDAVCASVDTDGIDGPTDAAGALVHRLPWDAAPDAAAALRSHDVYEFLDEHDLLLRSGPTGTNVNDLRVVLVDA